MSARYCATAEESPVDPSGSKVPLNAYRHPKVMRAREMIVPPTRRVVRRPILSTYNNAGIVKQKFISPEIPEAWKLAWRDGNPACVKIIGAK